MPSPARIPPAAQLWFWNFLNFDALLSISTHPSIPLYLLDSTIEHTEEASSSAGEKTEDYGMKPVWWDNDPWPHYMGSNGLGIILHSVA